MPTPLNDVSLIIKTFERQAALERLLDSILEQGYDDCPVFIADDSKEPYQDEILERYGDFIDEYIVLPFDSGLPKGRNELLKRVPTEYFVVNDDDFVYGEMTNLSRSKEELESGNLDILGGYILEKEKEHIFDWLPSRVSSTFGLYEEEWSKRVWIAKIKEVGDAGIAIESCYDSTASFKHCDLVLNFFIARTSSVRDTVGGWTPKLKSTGEHWEFFYRCKKAGLQVGWTESLGTYHLPEENDLYNQFRYRDEQKMLAKSLQEHGLKYLDRGDEVFYNPNMV